MDSMKIKYVVLDMDGTLLNSKNKISQINYNEIQRIKKQNVRVIICSGRHFNEIEEYIVELGLSEGDFVISCDGQYILDVNGNILYRNDYLIFDDVKKIHEIIPNTNIECFSILYNYQFKFNILSYIRAIILKKSRNKIYLKKIPNNSGECIEKMVINTKLSDNQRKKLCDYTVHELCGDRIEILHIGVSKYTALKYCLKENNVQEDEVLYFGDEMNDIECFQNLTHCIAMGNAINEIKRKAEFITKNNDEDGVAYALSKYVI